VRQRPAAGQHRTPRKPFPGRPAARRARRAHPVLRRPSPRSGHRERGALSDDPTIQTIITEELDIVGRRLVEGLDLHGHAHDVAVLAVHGWLVFVRAVCVEWIQTQTISRTELTQMCLRAFAGAVAPVVDLGAALG